MAARTENGCAAHPDAGNPLIDLFFNLVPGVSDARVTELVAAAFEVNPVMTLKIVMHERSVRLGKGRRDTSYACMRAIQGINQDLYARNLVHFAEYGYTKDLLQLCENPSPQSVELQTVAHQVRNARIELEKGGNPGLVVKWAPSESSQYKAHARVIARLIAPWSTHPDQDYRKFLTEARSKLNLVEVLSCDGRFNEINFEHLPARAARRYQNMLTARCGERYQDYLRDLENGKARAHSTGTQPHELTKASWTPVIQAQWTDMIDRLKEAGSLGRSIAMTDVSGSMDGTPMDVSIALGLVLCELTSPPFRDHVITFSERPVWHKIEGDTLRDRFHSISRQHVGYSTDVAAAFDLILQKCIDGQVPPDQAPDKLFLFSDMQFDQANDSDQTAYDRAKSKFEEKGYQLPKIIFWNLGAGDNAPVTFDQNGTAMVSGFSAVLMKAFMNGGDFDPMTILHNLVDKFVVSA